MHDEKYAKIAISLPAPLLQRIERLRERAGASRSRLIREAVERYVVATEREERLEAMAESYRRHPETAEELALIDALNRASADYFASELPWDAETPEPPAR
jgi:metal-responsive CopG/Arc/MetJ family transcriptional regulator